MTNGQKVVETAEQYLGHQEQPLGSNRSELIDQWQKHWGMVKEPWCGIYVSAMFREAGVDDSGIANPGTWVMADTAQRKGLVWNGKGKVPVGAIWILSPLHTGIVVEDLGENVLIIDGNSSNMVRKTVRPKQGLGVVIAIPPAVLEGKPTKVRKTEWYLRDKAAKPYAHKVNGKIPQWKAKVSAERTIEGMLNGPNRATWAPLKPRAVRAGNGNHVIQIGGIPLYGPWQSSKDAVLKAKKNLEKQLGRKLEVIERNYLVKE